MGHTGGVASDTSGVTSQRAAGSRRLWVVMAAVLAACACGVAVGIWLHDEDPGSGVAPAALVRERLDEGARVIDVRTPEEYAAGHVAGAVLADVATGDFDREIAELPPEDSYVVYCASGRRAAGAVERMEAAGFSDVVNGGGFDRMVELGAPAAPG